MRTRLVVPRLALVAGMLTAVGGCDKAAAFTRGAATATATTEVSSGDSTDLSRRPHVLYQVFGERADPRILPVAELSDGRIKPLVLSREGWHRFDSLYHKVGAQYTIYHHGREAGWARVIRPMWNAKGSLYTLPRCQQLTPLAGAIVKAPPPVGYMVEHIATDAPIPDLSRTRRIRTPSDGGVAAAKAVANTLAANANIEPSTLAGLDFRSVAIPTGVSEHPTLAVSYIDPSGGNAAKGNATHLFALADRVGTGDYVPTYRKVVRSWTPKTEYRRYVDHIDLTGDGVDELILEAWSTGHESYMLILQFDGGHWTEAFRGRVSWCLDRE